MTNTIKSNAPGRIFKEAYNAIKEEIPFNLLWKNGTGYFDFAVKGDHAPQLTINQIVKSFDPNGRRVIMVGTRFGNVVVFDRYSNQDEAGIYVSNKPFNKSVESLVGSGSVSEAQMANIVGAWGNLEHNISYKLEQMAQEFYAEVPEKLVA